MDRICVFLFSKNLKFSGKSLSESLIVRKSTIPMYLADDFFPPPIPHRRFKTKSSIYLQFHRILFPIFSVDVWILWPSLLKAQCHVTVNKLVISRIYIVAHTWPLRSAQISVDRVNPD